MNLPVVLTIAGSDSGGGAGIQADLKTFQAYGCFGTTAVAAVTCQNTNGVRAIQAVEPEIVAGQIQAVMDDLPVRAIKTGMLLNAEIIQTVRAVLESYASREVPLIVDPVMVATSGDLLLEEDAVRELLELMKLADLITPNLHEAEVLTGRTVETPQAMEEAAIELFHRTDAQVLLKGGHLPGDDIVDLFYDGAAVDHLRAVRLGSIALHGTGCTLSAAVAAGLALGMSMKEAVMKAREFVQGAIELAPELGAGSRPLNHLWKQMRT